MCQDRLDNELHYKNITTYENANEYLIDTYIPEFNRLFGHPLPQKYSVFEKISNDDDDLNLILSVVSVRIFDSGNSIRYKNKTYLTYNADNELVPYRKGTKCTVIEALDGKLYAQVYNEIYKLIELQSVLSENETKEEYYKKIKSSKKEALPMPRKNWDKDVVEDDFERIHIEYGINDSHNPKW